MANHNYNFAGGEILTKIGASWFISYTYYINIDRTHLNWSNVSPKSCKGRQTAFKKGVTYYKAWLTEITNMNPKRLKSNKLGLSAKQVLDMAKKLLTSPLLSYGKEGESVSCFSERLFETLVNHILLNTLKCDIYIPSQVKEASSGLDALFQRGGRKLLAIQYKVVEQYQRIPTGLTAAAFHFDIHSKEQHNHLVKKSNKMLAGYVVPAFVSYQALFDTYHNGTLLNDSYFIQPDIKIRDSNYHQIKFDRATAFLCSKDPQHLAIYSLAELQKMFCESIKWTKEGFLNEYADEWQISRDENSPKEIEEKVTALLAKNRIVLFAL